MLFRGKKPRKILIAKGVSFKHLSYASWGEWVQIGKNVDISAWGKKGFQLGSHVTIGSYSKLFVSYSLNEPGVGIKIGSRVGIGDFAHLGGAGGLEIGKDCIIGPYLSCHPENHRFEELNLSIRLQGHTRKGIIIGPDCWIGAKVTILDGVEIGKGSVVAAGAVVTKPFPPFSIIGGVPARLLGTRLKENVSDQLMEKING